MCYSDLVDLKRKERIVYFHKGVSRNNSDSAKLAPVKAYLARGSGYVDTRNVDPRQRIDYLAPGNVYLATGNAYLAPGNV